MKPCSPPVGLALALTLAIALLWAAPAHAQRVGTSPFTPPKADDINFVVDAAAGLDTACTFRGGGPLRFSIKTTRFIAPTNPDGTLIDAAALVAAGIVGATAKLTMPGFDVDSAATPPPPLQPERDRVLLNGQPIGFLAGVNNAWVMNSFEIPIERLRFPSRGANGTAPTPVDNPVEIQIDTANADEVWCTAVDWAALAIKALSPVILIHGNNSDGAFYERMGFTTTLRTRRVAFDNSISMPTDTVAAHATLLDTLIPDVTKSFGVDSVHLVAHSKGGLDSRDYLARHQAAHNAVFKVLSLTTLSTPHNGSVLADVKVEYEAAAARANLVNFNGFPGMVGALARLTGLDTGTPNLTTAFAAGFNAGNLGLLPADTTFNTVSADADTNGNAAMDSTPDEYAELRSESTALANIHSVSTATSRGIVNAMYQTLRTTRAVTVTFTTRTIFGRPVFTTATITAVPQAAVGNDTLVTIPSGQGAGGLAGRVAKRHTFSGAAGRNHSNVANGGVASIVLPWIFDIERRNGDLKP